MPVSDALRSPYEPAWDLPEDMNLLIKKVSGLLPARRVALEPHHRQPSGAHDHPTLSRVNRQPEAPTGSVLAARSIPSPSGAAGRPAPLTGSAGRYRMDASLNVHLADGAKAGRGVGRARLTACSPPAAVGRLCVPT